MSKKPGNPNIVEAGKTTRFPHNDPTKGGRYPTKKLRELLEEITDEEDLMRIARNLQKKAGADVNWFREYAKVMGEYAPTETIQTGSMDHTLQNLKNKTDEELKAELDELRKRRKGTESSTNGKD